MACTSIYNYSHILCAVKIIKEKLSEGSFLCTCYKIFNIKPKNAIRERIKKTKDMHDNCYLVSLLI